MIFQLPLIPFVLFCFVLFCLFVAAVVVFKGYARPYIQVAPCLSVFQFALVFFLPLSLFITSVSHACLVFKVFQFCENLEDTREINPRDHAITYTKH